MRNVEKAHALSHVPILQAIAQKQQATIVQFAEQTRRHQVGDFGARVIADIIFFGDDLAVMIFIISMHQTV